MKLAIIFDNFGPYHLARLKASGDVCSLFACEMNHRSIEYPWLPGVAARNFQSITLNYSRPLNPLRLSCRLRRTLARLSPDCVFVPGWSRLYALGCLSWCAATKTPAVVMSETSENDANRSRWKEWLKRRIVGIARAAFVGGAPHAEYMGKLGVHPSRIFQGYDAVDNDYFRQAAEDARNRAGQLRHSLHLPAHYFLASARFIPQKNLLRLLLAFARYRGSAASFAKNRANAGRQAWSLVLLGDGRQKPALQNLIREHGLEPFVHLPGFKQYGELPSYYGLASAFVHASTCEPWGLVVNEAMACGLPVLVSNRCGCARDLVQAPRNGFTFDPANLHQLGDLMLRISTREHEAAAMGEASSQIIAAWGLSRFCCALRAAANKAVASLTTSLTTW